MTKEVIHRHMATHTTPLIISQYAETSDPAPNRSEETLQVRYIRPSQKYTLPPPPFFSIYLSANGTHTFVISLEGSCKTDLLPQKLVSHHSASTPLPSHPQFNHSCTFCGMAKASRSVSPLPPSPRSHPGLHEPLAASISSLSQSPKCRNTFLPHYRAFISSSWTECLPFLSLVLSSLHPKWPIDC